MNLEHKNETTLPLTYKLYQKFKPLLIISSAAVGLGLSSCVDPGYSSYGGGTQYTTYSTGHRINSLPGGYRTENISGRTYYYHNGHYYQPSSGGYTVVTAPRTSRYYTEYSRYRQPDSSDHGRGGYDSRDRNDSRYDSRNRNDPRYDSYGRNDQGYGRTQVITRLPSGYRSINHRGTTYYQSGDSYYSRQGNGYVIVERPF